MRKIVFTKDFSTRKKGDIIDVDGILATTLISRKVAKYYKKQSKK